MCITPCRGPLSTGAHTMTPCGCASQLDQQISSLVASAREHRRRRAILMGLAVSPVDLINGLLAAQTRELRTAAGGPMGAFNSQGQPPQALRRSQHFRGEWVEDAVLRFLHRRLAVMA